MNNFWGNIFKTHQDEEEMISGILAKVPVFEDLNKRGLLQIRRILHRREYHAGEVIFFEGEPGLGMYIIEEGAVEIVCGPDKKLLAELHSGDFFGELALLDDSPRAATAMAKTACKMLCFFQPDLFDFIERNPRLGVKLLFRFARTIGERLKKSNEKMPDLKKGGQDWRMPETGCFNDQDK